MDHIGIDVHKKESQICILAEGGELIERRIPAQPRRFGEGLHSTRYPAQHDSRSPPQGSGLTCPARSDRIGARCHASSALSQGPPCPGTGVMLSTLRLEGIMADRLRGQGNDRRPGPVRPRERHHG